MVVGHCLHLWVLVGGNGGQCLFVGCGGWPCMFGNGGSSSPMLGVVMGHCLGGWWWALVAICVNTVTVINCNGQL